MFHSYKGRMGTTGRKRVKTALGDAKHHQRLQGPRPKKLPHKRGPSSHAGTYLDPNRGN